MPRDPPGTLTIVDIRIGILNSPRELAFETSESAADITAAITAAMEKGAPVVSLTDSKGKQYLVPGRQSHGLLLVPLVGAAATAAVWAVCVWIGLPFDGGWIWVIALVGGPLIALALALTLPKRREHADAALLERLMKPGAAAKA